MISLAAWLALAPRSAQAKETELGIPLLPPWQEPSRPGPSSESAVNRPRAMRVNGRDSGESLGQEQASVRAYRRGLSELLRQARGRPEIFRPSEPREFLLPEYRDSARGIWVSAMDYWMALESAQRRSRALASSPRATQRRAALSVFQAASLARSGFAVQWTRMIGDAPLLEKLFNEELPELGLAAGGYFAVRAVVRARESTPLFPTSSEAKPLPPIAGLEREFPLTKEDLNSLSELLEPGDVLLARREHYLDDIGSAGFWHHAALYAGSGGFLEPGREASTQPIASEARADFLAVLRPRLDETQKADALGRAFALLRDAASGRRRGAMEIVRRAYGPALGDLGSANDLARGFDVEFGTQAQRFDFVLFWGPKAQRSTLEEFRRSWRRPKWTHGKQENQQ